MKKRTGLVVLLLLVFTMVFAGCGKKTLEDIFSTKENKAALQQEVDSAKDMFKDYYTDITFEVTGNDVSYNYYLAEGIEVDLSAVDTTLLEQQAETFKDNSEKTFKIRPTSVTYNYYDSEGNVLESYKY